MATFSSPLHYRNEQDCNRLIKATESNFWLRIGTLILFGVALYALSNWLKKTCVALLSITNCDSLAHVFPHYMSIMYISLLGISTALNLDVRLTGKYQNIAPITLYFFLMIIQCICS